MKCMVPLFISYNFVYFINILHKFYMVLVQKLDVTLASVKPGRFSSSETNYISYHGDLELKFSTEKMTDVISFGMCVLFMITGLLPP